MADSSNIVLTVEGVRRMVEQRLSTAAEIEETKASLLRLESDLAAQDKRIEAAFLFLTDDDKEAVLRPKTQHTIVLNDKATLSDEVVAGLVKESFALSPVEGGGEGEDKASWSQEILRILNAAGRGMSHAGIIEELRKSPLGDGLANSTKRYYTTVTRLIGRNLVERRGQLFYSMYVLDRLISRGEAVPEEATGSDIRDDNNTSGLIVRTLSPHPDGMSGADLVDALALLPEATSSILRHPQFVYNVLGKMVRQSKLIKEGRMYRVPSKEIGPPSAEAASGPDEARGEVLTGPSLLRPINPKLPVH